MNSIVTGNISLALQSTVLIMNIIACSYDKHMLCVQINKKISLLHGFEAFSVHFHIKYQICNCLVKLFGVVDEMAYDTQEMNVQCAYCTG